MNIMANLYNVQRGDGWIRIANKHGISLNDLLYWNGIDPSGELPMLHPEDKVYVSDPYSIKASGVTANAPRDYIDYGAKGQELINNYALAVKQGKINLNKVPEIYREAVYQKMITNSTDKAANTIGKIGLNTGLFLLDPIGYTLSAGAQKGLAYINDAASGRNEYGIEDLFSYTPIKGTEYAEEHPVRSMLIDTGAGIAGGGLVRNIPNIWKNVKHIIQNARNAAQNAVSMTGLPRETLIFPDSKQTFNTVYRSGSKGSGKTGTVRAGGKNSGGFRANSSGKGTFGNKSTSSNEIRFIVPDVTIPTVPYVGTRTPYVPVTGPIYWNEPKDPEVIVHTPERHIREQQTFNRWQFPNPSGKIGEYIPGTGIISISGDAPIGNTITDQALTNESIKVGSTYIPRRAVYVPGTVVGTPSRIYSGLGITYGSVEPKSLIIK